MIFCRSTQQLIAGEVRPSVRKKTCGNEDDDEDRRDEKARACLTSMKRCAKSSDQRRSSVRADGVKKCCDQDHRFTDSLVCVNKNMYFGCEVDTGVGGRGERRDGRTEK